MFRRILLLGLIFATENALTGQGSNHDCSSYQELKLAGIEDTCQQIVIGTGHSWLRMICQSGYSKPHHRCFFWCRAFASCLNLGSDWRKNCTNMFSQFGSPQLNNITMTAVKNNDASYHLQVKNCQRGSPDVFAIKIALLNSGSAENDRLRERSDFSKEDAMKYFDSTIQQYLNKVTATGKCKTVEENMEEIFLAMTALEESLLDIQVRKIFYQNESDFHLQETNGENFLRIPSANLENGSVVLGIIYKDLHQVLMRNVTDTNTINKDREINTIVMSGTISPQPMTLQQNVTLKFRNRKAATFKRNCMFWNGFQNSPVGWSGQGCYVKSMDKSQTECSCNHLTHFTVLMQFDAASGQEYGISETDEKSLEIITYLGLTLSLLGFTLTIISYVSLTDMKGPLSQIRVSLVASLGAGQIIFLAGIGATENKGACVTVAALVQYFLMAAFCWVLVEGIYLYLFIVKVYNVSDKLKICHGISWGFPALIVAISLSNAAGKEGIESFVSDKYCWMSSANGLIWIFVAFVVFIELFNILILGRVIKEMTTMQQAKDKHTEQIRLGVKACVVMIPLLGITWLFGLLSPLHKAFGYIFTIFNSTQGFLIFLLHCVRNTKIRARFKRRIHAIFPAVDDGISTKRVSEVNESATAIVALRKINVQPRSKDNETKESSRKTSL